MSEYEESRAPWLIDEPFVKFGRRPNASGSAFDDIFKGTAGTPDQWIIATPGTATVTSSNAGDANGVVTLIGYDVNGKVQSEPVTLDASATPTATSSKTWYHAIPRAFYDRAGSARAPNSGEITIVVSTVTVAIIEAEAGQTFQAFYMIPTAFEDGRAISSARLTRWYSGCGKSGDFEVAVQTSANGSGWRSRALLHVNDGSPDGIDYRTPTSPKAGLHLSPMMFVKMVAKRKTGTTVHGWFELELRANG